METQNLVISFDYSWFLAKNLAYAECPIMKFHYRNSSNIETARHKVQCWSFPLLLSNPDLGSFLYHCRYVVSKSMILDRFSKSLGKTTPKPQHNIPIIKKIVIFINHRFRIRWKIEQKRLNMIYICFNFSQEPKTTLCKDPQ